MEVENLLNYLVQYGLAGAALYMLYNIMQHKLSGIDQKLLQINEKLVEIREELEKLREALAGR